MDVPVQLVIVLVTLFTLHVQNVQMTVNVPPITNYIFLSIYVVLNLFFAESGVAFGPFPVVVIAT